MPRIKLTLKSKLYCNAFPHVINTKLKNKYKDRNQNKNNRLVSFKKINLNIYNTYPLFIDHEKPMIEINALQ